jgi:hypothetical protein
VCGAERRAPSGARTVPLCHACCLLLAPSLARPAALPAWVMQPAATASLFLCVMYRVPRAHLSALGPALVALVAGCSPGKAPVFSFSTTPSSTTPSATPSTTPRPETGQKSAITGFRTSWGGADFSVVATASTSTSPTHQPSTRGSVCNRPLRRNFLMCCRLPANKGASGVAQHQHQHHSQHAPAAPACRPHPLPLPGYPLAGGGGGESRGGRRGRRAQNRSWCAALPII